MKYEMYKLLSKEDKEEYDFVTKRNDVSIMDAGTVKLTIGFLIIGWCILNYVQTQTILYGSDYVLSDKQLFLIAGTVSVFVLLAFFELIISLVCLCDKTGSSEWLKEKGYTFNMSKEKRK